MTSVTRELLPGGVVRLSSDQATFEFARPRLGTLLVTISGIDKGQFGPSTLSEITAALDREGSLELFIDARKAVGAAVSVSDEWTRFFSVQRSRLRRVHVLAPKTSSGWRHEVAFRFVDATHVLEPRDRQAIPARGSQPDA